MTDLALTYDEPRSQFEGVPAPTNIQSEMRTIRALEEPFLITASASSAERLLFDPAAASGMLIVGALHRGWSFHHRSVADVEQRLRLLARPFGHVTLFTVEAGAETVPLLDPVGDLTRLVDTSTRYLLRGRRQRRSLEQRSLDEAVTADVARALQDVSEAASLAPPVVAKDTDPPAFRAFRELSDWLLLSDADAATLVGLGRTTPYSWQRDGHEPRPKNARRLYETYALVDALVRRMGATTARSWLEQGDPSPMALLRAGDVEAATNAAQRIIFPRRGEGWTELGGLVEEPPDDASQGSIAGEVPRLRRRRGRTIRPT